MHTTTINVFSAFDGMSCGALALKKAGINVGEYYASEIDPHAMKVSMENFEHIKHTGSIKFAGKGMLGKTKIDLLMGGSPCQGFSFAGKQLNFEDPRSKLFFEFVRLKNELNPRYFLLENVPMKEKYRDVITEHLGVIPVMIDSKDFSAQNRKRWYWTNIPIAPYEDKKISIYDILEDKPTESGLEVPMSFFSGLSVGEYLEKQKQTAFLPMAVNYSSSGRGQGKVEGRHYQALKSHTVTPQVISRRSGTVIAQDGKVRKLSVLERRRLQTIPDWYRMPVSVTQANKMLGNGWTVDVIAHILKGVRYA